MGLLKAQTKKNTSHKKLAGEECTGENTHSMPMLRFPDSSKTLLPMELIPRPTRVATLSIVCATSYPSLGKSSSYTGTSEILYSKEQAQAKHKGKQILLTLQGNKQN